jgi:uncharacterized membrane protein YgdD (TMEM256/DUF423 family)
MDTSASGQPEGRQTKASVYPTNTTTLEIGPGNRSIGLRAALNAATDSTMPMTPQSALRLAALIGASAVALGAFGAHALQDHLLLSNRLGTWETATVYHLTHTLLLLFLAQHFDARPLPYFLCLGGILVFSGSLYLLCLSGWTLLGAITPIGGLLLIAAWLSLLFSKQTTPTNTFPQKTR